MYPKQSSAASRATKLTQSVILKTKTALSRAKGGLQQLKRNQVD
jgi:hypothetical protein